MPTEQNNAERNWALTPISAQAITRSTGAQQRRAVAKSITLLESTRADHREQADELLTELLPHTGNSLRLGISGVPGVGKSTFIEALGLFLIAQGHKVAVLTIDPSSTVSGGSILGDKTRMEMLSVNEKAYIRPSPSSGTLGGVAEKTREAMLVCEAAGYDIVIVETVGVGQSETAVAGMTDMFVLMQLPNAGDDLQAIKKGVMELADLVVINKADLDADASVGAILLRGEGSGFCSGGDLKEFQSATGSSAFTFHDGGKGWVTLMTVIRSMAKPVICAPHGYALAGGCGIVAASDIVIAAEGTQFGMSEVRIGLFPIVVLPTVAAAIGHRRARELALTGRRIDAQEALTAGLVHRVVPAEGFLQVARALADDIASLGPHALRLGKELLHRIEGEDIERATVLAKAMRGVFMSTPDFAEGVASFVEKRKPNFRPTA